MVLDGPNVLPDCPVGPSMLPESCNMVSTCSPVVLTWFLTVLYWTITGGPNMVPGGPHMVPNGPHMVPDGPHTVPDCPTWSVVPTRSQMALTWSLYGS